MGPCSRPPGQLLIYVGLHSPNMLVQRLINSPLSRHPSLFWSNVSISCFAESASNPSLSWITLATSSGLRTPFPSLSRRSKHSLMSSFLEKMLTNRSRKVNNLKFNHRNAINWLRVFFYNFQCLGNTFLLKIVDFPFLWSSSKIWGHDRAGQIQQTALVSTENTIWGCRKNLFR